MSDRSSIVILFSRQAQDINDTYDIKLVFGYIRLNAIMISMDVAKLCLKFYCQRSTPNPVEDEKENRFDSQISIILNSFAKQYMTEYVKIKIKQSIHDTTDKELNRNALASVPQYYHLQNHSNHSRTEVFQPVYSLRILCSRTEIATDKNEYTAYVIAGSRVSSFDSKITVCVKSFTELRAFASEIACRLHQPTFDFPYHGRLFGAVDKKQLEQRREQIDMYLQRISSDKNVVLCKYFLSFFEFDIAQDEMTLKCIEDTIEMVGLELDETQELHFYIPYNLHFDYKDPKTKFVSAIFDIMQQQLDINENINKTENCNEIVGTKCGKIFYVCDRSLGHKIPTMASQIWNKVICWQKNNDDKIGILLETVNKDMYSIIQETINDVVPIIKLILNNNNNNNNNTDTGQKPFGMKHFPFVNQLKQYCMSSHRLYDFFVTFEKSAIDQIFGNIKQLVNYEFEYDYSILENALSRDFSDRIMHIEKIHNQITSQLCNIMHGILKCFMQCLGNVILYKDLLEKKYLQCGNVFDENVINNHKQALLKILRDSGYNISFIVEELTQTTKEKFKDYSSRIYKPLLDGMYTTAKISLNCIALMISQFLFDDTQFPINIKQFRESFIKMWFQPIDHYFSDFTQCLFYTLYQSSIGLVCSACQDLLQNNIFNYSGISTSYSSSVWYQILCGQNVKNVKQIIPKMLNKNISLADILDLVIERTLTNIVDETLINIKCECEKTFFSKFQKEKLKHN